MSWLRAAREVIRRVVGARAGGRNGNLNARESAADRVVAANRSLYRFERPRERRGLEERRVELVKRQMIRNERRATRRSLVLLLRQMTPGQRADFREHGYFFVIGGCTGERYRIRVDLIANIDVLRDDGMARHRLCARLAANVPVYDVLAAQLLHLQDPRTERLFLQEANLHATIPEDHVFYRTTWTA